MKFYINFILLTSYYILADIYIKRKSDGVQVASVEDDETGFGPSAPYNGLTGHHIILKLKDPCLEDWPIPPSHSIMWFAVVNYTTKCVYSMILKAQLRGYHAVFIHRLGASDLADVVIQGNKSIVIPSSYISNSTLAVLEQYSSSNNYTTIYYRSMNDWPYLMLIIFIIFFLTGIAGILLGFLVYMGIRSCKKNKDLLARWKLKRIPCHYFQKGDVYDVCVICLDEYIEKDKLRILPCNHVFHSKCVDTWLSKNRKTCPLCKVELCINTKGYRWLCCFATGNLEICPTDERTPLLSAPEEDTEEEISPFAPSIQSSSNQTSVLAEIHHSQSHTPYSGSYGSFGGTPEPHPRFVVGSVRSEEDDYSNEEIV